MFNSGIFNEAVSKAQQESRGFRAIIDLSAVSAVDSCGLGMLVSLLKQAKQHDGYVHLVGVSAGLLELLYHSKLDHVFPRFESIDAALASGEAEQASEQALEAGLRISTSIRGNHLILVASGQLTSQTRERLRRSIFDEPSSQWPLGLVLHLADLSAVDADGLECLEQINQEVRRKVARVKLVKTPAYLVEMLHLAHLDVLFPRFDAVEDALAAAE